MPAKKSPRRGGPLTTLGKLRASENSITHGLFASEFHLSAEEISEYESLKSAFREDLKPSTPMLELLLADVVACWWRMRLALRHEQQQLQRQSATQSGAQCEQTDQCDSGLTAFPYPFMGLEIRKRLKLLDDAENALRRPTLLQDLKQPITRAFGAEFWESLTDYSLADTVLLQVAAMCAAKQEAYGPDFKITGQPPTPKEEEYARWANCHAHQQLQRKLLQMERVHLQLQLYWTRHAGVEGAETQDGRLDLSLRYGTTARRDFYRAMSCYLEMRKNLRPAVRISR